MMDCPTELTELFFKVLTKLASQTQGGHILNLPEVHAIFISCLEFNGYLEVY